MKKETRLLVCSLFMGVVLFLGAGKDLMKAEIVSWDAAPDPTIASISQEPNDAIMMGGNVLMELEVTDPQDWDTKTVTNTESKCSTKKIPEQDDITPSEWWIHYNPGEFLQTAALYNLTAPIRWEWETGSGDYGAYAAMWGFFCVWDGRTGDDPRYDKKSFFTDRATYKVIPDTIGTLLYTNHDQDPNGTGCQVSGTYHGGASFWHPLSNHNYPEVSFSGLVIKEKILFVLTDADYDPNDDNDPVVQRINGIKEGTTFSCTVNTDGRAWDNNFAGSPMEVFWDNGATHVTLYQAWEIVTGGWNGYNPDHGISKEVSDADGCFPPFGWCGSHTIRFERITSEFVRCWKNGITCLCDGP